MTAQPDYFIPEYWPADRILGLILDDQIQGLDASKIVGKIVNDQIAELAAEKILGKLTQEQIESIAAQQITGQLTDDQIAEIAAAKIIGQLTDEQLGGLSAAKIIGEIASGQISSLAAAKITGELTSAQIKTIEAAKVTGQLSDGQIKGLAVAKLEGLISSEQINNLAVAKLIGQISNSQIAAKAVTAGKIDVATLSAISVDAGIIEAGIFKGVTFESADGNTKLDGEGLSLKSVKTLSPGNTRRIRWVRGDNGALIADIYGTLYSFSDFQSRLTAKVVGPNGGGLGELVLIADEELGQQSMALVKTGGISRRIIDSAQKSDFLQLAETGKRIVNFGLSEVTFPGGSPNSSVKTIAHKLTRPPEFATGVVLGSEAATVPLTPRIITGSLDETNFKIRFQGPVNISATTISFLWIAAG